MRAFPYSFMLIFAGAGSWGCSDGGTGTSSLGQGGSPGGSPGVGGAVGVAGTSGGEGTASPGGSAGAPATAGTGGSAGGNAAAGAGAGGTGALGGSGGDSSAGSGGVGGAFENPDPNAPCPRCIKVFNGVDFEGWEASSSTWSIVEGGIMRGDGGSSRLAYTQQDYGSFRLVVTSRMNPVNGDHLGILFWGDRPENPDAPKIDNAGWLQWMPPHGGMWNYHPPMHKNLPHEELAEGSRDFAAWHTAELFCNLETGVVRAAVDGVEITRYEHPTPLEREDPETRIIAGPVGMFRHGGGVSEYKDIYIEDNPTEDVLYTVE